MSFLKKKHKHCINYTNKLKELTKIHRLHTHALVL